MLSNEEIKMNKLDDVVLDTVRYFLNNSLLFTGLDVSNKVKETIPFARHSEVSEAVRNLFVSEMEPEFYAKTPISVTLKDGSNRTALLYHPISDSFDLDNKYDAQKRNQVATKPANPVAATVNASGNVSITPPVAMPATPATPAPVAQQMAARDAWANLFSTQPSLFPRK